MKALFYVFLALNLFVLSVGLYREASPPAPSATTPKANEKPELLLLSERELPAAEPASGTTDSDDQAPTVATAPQAESAPKADPAPVTEPAPAAPPEIIVVEETKPAPVATVTLPETTTPLLARCRTLGPIATQERAADIVQRLEPLGIQAEQRTEAKKVARFLVVIPPAEDQTKAKQMVERLAAAGIKDVWMFYRGDMVNAISLGLYSRRGSAETRQRQVIAKGFAPEIVARDNEITRLWLDLDSSSEIEIDPATWKTIQDENKGINLTPRQCGAIVSASGSP